MRSFIAYFIGVTMFLAIMTWIIYEIFMIGGYAIMKILSVAFFAVSAYFVATLNLKVMKFTHENNLSVFGYPLTRCTKNFGDKCEIYKVKTPFLIPFLRIKFG